MEKNHRGISFWAVFHRTLSNSPMMFFRHHFPLPPTPISSLAALLWDSMRPVMHLHLPTLHLILFTNSVVDNLLWQCNHQPMTRQLTDKVELHSTSKRRKKCKATYTHKCPGKSSSIKCKSCQPCLSRLSLLSLLSQLPPPVSSVPTVPSVPYSLSVLSSVSLIFLSRLREAVKTT